MSWSTCTLPFLLFMCCFIPQLVFSLDECKNDTKSVCSSVAGTCPSCLKILWQDSLSRSPYSQKIDNTTNVGILFGKFFYGFLKLTNLLRKKENTPARRAVYGPDLIARL